MILSLIITLALLAISFISFKSLRIIKAMWQLNLKFSLFGGPSTVSVANKRLILNITET